MSLSNLCAQLCALYCETRRDLTKRTSESGYAKFIEILSPCSVAHAAYKLIKY